MSIPLFSMTKLPILILLACSAIPAAADPVYTWSVLAGMTGGRGNADGPLSAARFYVPSGIAFDGSGNAYVADSGNLTIRKITISGMVSTLAGESGMRGFKDGSGAAAQFNGPNSVAVDGEGNVFVADFGNHTIRKVSPDGIVTTLAGKAGETGDADGQGGDARFHYPAGVAVDTAGNVYVTDVVNQTIRQITEQGEVFTLAGSRGLVGSTDGSGPAARFNRPMGITLDREGNLYVADTGNHLVRKILRGGAVTTMGGKAGSPGSADGLAADSKFNEPYGVAVNESGDVYVADSGNHTIRIIHAAGTVGTIAGRVGEAECRDGSGPDARFSKPVGLAMDHTGHLLVAETGSFALRKLSTDGTVSTLTGRPLSSGSADGMGELARFKEPSGLAVDRQGNVYVGDYNNYTLRKISPGGMVSTMAGAAGIPGIEDGQGSMARFSKLGGVAVDAVGNVVVTDTDNFTIRRINGEGTVSTLAGRAYVQGDTDGTTNARFRRPKGIALDGGGNAYVVGVGAVRKITPAGVVSTLAGKNSVGGSADGTGPEARFNLATATAVDIAGNIFVADTLNHTIRRVSQAGVVTTIAGKAGEWGSADGLGLEARFNHPCGVAVDGQGTLFVADAGNQTIRRLKPDGRVSTIGGQVGQAGHTNGIAGAALFSNPQELAVDLAGNLYLADMDNNAIRKGIPVHVPVLSSMERWRQLHFSSTANSGDGANGFDFDSDGLPNFIEYALGLDPRNCTPVPWTLTLGSGQTLVFQYSRSVEAFLAGTEYTVEWSETATGDWSTNGITETVLSEDSALQQVQAVIQASGSGKCFVRLRIFPP